MPEWVKSLQEKIMVECKICHAKIPASQMKAHMDNHIQTSQMDERPLALFKKSD